MWLAEYLLIEIVLMLVMIDRLKSVGKAFVVSLVFLYTFLVFQAEILSLFHVWNLPVVIVSGFAVLIIISIWFSLERRRVWENINDLKVSIDKMSIGQKFIEAIFYLALIIIVTEAVLKNISFPPQNFDSLQYHLPRNFLFWKNKSIENIPISHTFANYVGPLNGILCAFLRIFSHGGDRLINFIQLPTWIAAIFSVGYISERLLTDIADSDGIEKTIAKYMSMVLALTLPMSMFQASTTQSDLLMGSFTVMAVFALFECRYDKENRMLYALMGGLSGGLSMLAKNNAMITLGVLAFVFIWFLWTYRDSYFWMSC